MSWHATVADDAWLAAVTDPNRLVSSRVEVVSFDGPSLGDIACYAVTVSVDADRAEQWAASFTFSDATVVPTSTTSVLDGRSGLWLRVWWQLDTASGWQEIPLGTFVVEDSEWSDAGTLSGTVPGLDPLAVARRGKYGAAVINVGGLTVSTALRHLFESVAPGFPVSIEPSTVTLPAQFELWARDPAEDWTEIAAMAGMVVRTDRLGVITVARPPESSTPAADWQEGAACPVVELGVKNKTSTIPRRVVVVSTNPDVVPPVVGSWDNPDADSQMIVTETRVESSTVTTVEAATNLAMLTGTRWARPQQTVEVTVPARPDLDMGDLVSLSRQRVGVAGLYRVGGWSLDLRGPDQPPAAMRVQMMARQ